MHVTVITRHLARVALLVCLFGSANFAAGSITPRGMEAQNGGWPPTPGLGGTGSGSYIEAVVLRDRDADTAWAAAADAEGAREERLCSIQHWRAHFIDTPTIDSRTGDRGVLSITAVANRHGHAGNQHAPEVAGAKWRVRHRLLDSELGRWTTRDVVDTFSETGLCVAEGINSPHHLPQNTQPLARPLLTGSTSNSEALGLFRETQPDNNCGDPCGHDVFVKISIVVKIRITSGPCPTPLRIDRIDNQYTERITPCVGPCPRCADEAMVSHDEDITHREVPGGPLPDYPNCTWIESRWDYFSKVVWRGKCKTPEYM